MGEDPNKVFLVGGLGQDNLKRLKKLLDRPKVRKEINFKFGKIITHYPSCLKLFQI